MTITCDGNPDNERVYLGAVSCRTIAGAFLHSVCLRFFVVCWVIAFGLAFNPDGSFAQTSSEPKIQDFRKKPLGYFDQIEDQNLQPKLDKDYLLRRLMRVLSDIAPPMLRDIPGVKGSLFKTEALTYHIVVRFGGFSEQIQPFYDFHIGKTISESSHNHSPVDKIYQKAIIEMAQRMASVGRLVAVDDPNHADLLIYINLANSAQSSAGFSRAQMSPFSQRRANHIKKGSKLNSYVYALPWSIVQVYFEGVLPKSPILGGEIWIQYPIRTLLQEALARASIDDSKISKRLGLGTSRSEIVKKFETPSTLDLKPFELSISEPTPLWEGPRPAETLLSAAAEAATGFKDRNFTQSAFPPPPECYEYHAKTLANRLGRAMGIFIGGITANGLQVAPSMDYTSVFERAPNELLADLSLHGNEKSFDLRLDDLLTVRAVEYIREFYAKNPGNYRDRWGSDAYGSRISGFDWFNVILHHIVGSVGVDIKNVALSLNTGEGCVSRSTIRLSYPD